MSEQQGDQAFRNESPLGRWEEMTYGGALSFLRRRYTREIAGADIVVSGVPYDAAVTYRPGCRLGPRAIRAASVQLAELRAFPWGFDPFETLAVVDAGDCMVDPHHPESVIESIESHAAHILAAGAKPLTFGGDHFVAYPLLRAQARQHGPIALVQFDAHCDTWADDGRAMDHGTMFARAVAEGVIDTARSTQVGLRTFNDTDAGFEILTAPWIHRHGIHAAIDIVATWQALEFVRGLSGLNQVGMDLVEVSPPYDHAEITAIAAATIAHDWLCVLAADAGATPRPVGRV